MARKVKSKEWYIAVRRANRARRGTHNAFSPRPKLKALWAGGYGKKMRKERKDRFKDPVFKKRQVAATHSIEVLKKHRKSMAQWWSETKNYKRMLKVRKVQANRPKERKRLTELVKASWRDPEIRKRMMASRKRQANRPGERERKQRVAAKLWATPKFRVKMMKSRHKTMYGPEWRENVSLAIHKAFPKGRTPWNKGLTKDDHPGLTRMSVAQRGQIPDYNKYRCWYPNDSTPVIRMRSSWEVGYALYLDSKKIKWLYEPKSFYIGKGAWRGESYKPDFYLPATKTYHEVKGYQSGVEAKKLQTFSKSYPDIKLKVFTKTELRKLGIIDCYNKVIKRAA